jgi:hypothetical protein
MSLQYSGTISLGHIALEMGGPTINKSLTSLSVSAGKAADHGIKEFYGYTRKYVSFSSLYSIGYNGSASGTVTITSAANFSAAALKTNTGGINVSITVGGITRTATRSTAGTTLSAAFQRGTGTYAYSLTVSSLVGTGSGYIDVVMV